MIKSTLLLSFASVASVFAGQSALNALNENTGDFGGAPFPLREQLETFIETDSLGDVTAYGFYMPKLSNLGIDNTVPNLSGTPLGAALDFDKSHLKDPSQVPFEFIGINYNPAGHPGVEYLIPHFDLHLWFEPSEFSRGIECSGTGFPPCLTTPWLAARFNNTPAPEYYPPGYLNNPDEWVPTMGAHLVPNPIPNDFETNPAVIIGSYLGKVVYYEPMVASKIFLNSETTTQTFSWPKLKYPKPGRYFTGYSISYDSLTEKYKFSFDVLTSSPEEYKGTPLFFGAQFNPATPIAYSGPVSPSKDCLIKSGSIIDGGYKVTAGSLEFCCRARGNYDGLSCFNNVCGSPQPLVPASPSSYFFNFSSGKCYARCVERID